ncbi:MAG: hypothetical protein ACE5EM_12425 [Sphingomonadales bacterium]
MESVHQINALKQIAQGAAILIQHVSPAAIGAGRFNHLIAELIYAQTHIAGCENLGVIERVKHCRLPADGRGPEVVDCRDLPKAVDG